MYTITAECPPRGATPCPNNPGKRRWRELPPEDRLRISLRARSMAFAEEPVDEKTLEAELERLLEPLGLSIRDEPNKA
jgi:hypothetical protein